MVGVVLLAVVCNIHVTVCVICPFSVDNNVALFPYRSLKRIVDVEVVAGDVVFCVVAVANEEGTVGILVIDIVGARFRLEGEGIVMRAVPTNFLYAHCGVGEGESLKLPIFVSSVENQFPVVRPFHAEGIAHGWPYVETHVVLSLVLCHYGENLLVGICDVEFSVAEGHRQLLMAFVHVDVSVCCHVQ